MKKRYFFFSSGAGAVDRPFIIQINSGADSSFTIPTFGGGYNYKVSTSDGQTFTGVTGNLTITFPSANTNYDISISGSFPRIYFNNGTERLKLIDIKQWGDIEWTSMDRAFFGCSNTTCTATDTPNLSSVTSTGRMFQGCTSLATPYVSQWNLSSVTDASYMFYDCYLWDDNLNSLDVSSLVNARDMLRNSGFTNDGVTLDWSDTTTGSINLENAHAFAYNTGLLGYKLQAGNIDLHINNNFTNSATLTELIGMKTSFYIANAPITGSAIDNLFTSLGTANSGATITITTVQSTSGIDTTIATNKGWTIVIV